MTKKCTNIILAYIFNVLFIVMSFLMMESDYDVLQGTFLIVSSVYLIYWIVLNRKSYMPWAVYAHFVVGVAVQTALNYFGVIPKDGGWFSGLGQFIYIIILLILTALLGIANLILYAISKNRS